MRKYFIIFGTIGAIFLIIIIILNVTPYFFPGINLGPSTPALFATGIITSFSTFISLNNTLKPACIEIKLLPQQEEYDILFFVETINHTERPIYELTLSMDDFILTQEEKIETTSMSLERYKYKAHRKNDFTENFINKKTISIFISYRLHGDVRNKTKRQKINNPFYYPLSLNNQPPC